MFRFYSERSNIWQNTNDAKKCFVRKLYGIEAGIFFSFYPFGLATTLQSAVEVTLKFFNCYLHLLLYVLVANIQMFSKRYKVASST